MKEISGDECFDILDKTSEKFPKTEYVCRNQICLPLYPGLKDEEAEYVVKSLVQELKN